jgi:hypothetical protein
MLGWLALYPQLRKNALIVPYEQIDRRPWLAVLRIAHAIFPAVHPWEVFRIARSLSKATVKSKTDKLSRDDPGVFDGGFSHWDTQTFFHRRHVSHLQSRPAEQRLPPEQLRLIQELFAAAIAAAGPMIN